MMMPVEKRVSMLSSELIRVKLIKDKLISLLGRLHDKTMTLIKAGYSRNAAVSIIRALHEQYRICVSIEKYEKVITDPKEGSTQLVVLEDQNIESESPYIKRHKECFADISEYTHVLESAYDQLLLGQIDYERSQAINSVAEALLLAVHLEHLYCTHITKYESECVAGSLEKNTPRDALPEKSEQGEIAIRRTPTGFLETTKKPWGHVRRHTTMDD